MWLQTEFGVWEMQSLKVVHTATSACPLTGYELKRTKSLTGRNLHKAIPRLAERQL
jgi:hypothetical protein